MPMNSPKYSEIMDRIATMPAAQARETLARFVDLVYASGAGTFEDPNVLEEYPTAAFIEFPSALGEILLNDPPR